MRLVSELRWRNVFRRAVLYLVATWLIMQVTEVLMALVGLPASVVAEESKAYAGPIIDMHMHAVRSGPLTSDGEARPLPCSPRPCDSRPGMARSGEDVFRMTLEAMDRHNIVLGFLSVDLEYTFEWVKRAPGRFIASPWVCDPAYVDFERIEAEYEAGRLQGMGEVSSQYCGLAIDDPGLDKVFALADQYDVPVLVHSHGSGAAGRERFRIEIGRPTRIEEVLVKYPELRLYIEDSGFPYLEDTVALMYRYSNVYGDLSNISWKFPRNVFHKYLKNLIDYGLESRLMFGTDAAHRPETIAMAIDAIESATFLTDVQKADIFYNNAARFLRLSDEEIAGHHKQ